MKHILVGLTSLKERLMKIQSAQRTTSSVISVTSLLLTLVNTEYRNIPIVGGLKKPDGNGFQKTRTRMPRISK